MINKIKYTDGFWKAVKMKCPCCHKDITFGNPSERYLEEYRDEYGIKVNMISNGKICIPNMLMLEIKCSNPLCEWSTVKWDY
jgi:hypothetical protein